MAIADQIVGAESGGDASAKNPNSSASGAGQFIDSTWLDTLAKHRPDLTGSREDLLAMRSDPQLSRDMTAAYASDNAGILKQAGLPVTPGTTYLAHFAGPTGAVGILNADPATPAGAVLGAGVVKANPFLAKMSAGDLAAWASRRVGGQTAPLSIAGPQQRAPQTIAPAQQAAPPAQTYAAPPEPQQQASATPMPQPAAPQQQTLNLLPQRRIYQIPAPFSFRGIA